MQSNIVVDGNEIKGTLKFIEGGIAPGVLEGDGYFLALKWSDPDEDATSLKVGLVPSSSGMDLIECIDDTDRNGVFKITNKDTQSLVIVQSNADGRTVQQFSLASLVLELGA